MSYTDTDILVAGGGIAGMIASLVFASSGFRVVCVDAAAAPDGAQKDLRSTAFLMPSIHLLSQAGIFSKLEPLAAPLRLMRIVDGGGEAAVARETVDFDAKDAGEAQFGWNIPNAPLRENLLGQIDTASDVEMVFGDAVVGQTSRLNETFLRLESGRQISARLCVAADGRHSRLRDIAGIGKTTIRYGQKAIVFTVTHQDPHNGVSTEVHRTGGPFTLVPLNDPNRSAVVWMEAGANAARLMSLDDEAFETQLNIRSCGVMGDLKLDGKRAQWPIISQYADRLTGPRLALVAEAAHVVPPIGAQGLNMSLADIACLRDLMEMTDDRAEIGAAHLLDQYHRKRWRDMRTRVMGIDALNRASMAENRLFRDLRSMGLSALGRSPGLRKTAIQQGMGL